MKKIETNLKDCYVIELDRKGEGDCAGQER